ncbi:MAG: flagellar biosynthetic protein FliO [Dehalococcoidia bacterium]|nr:flagellar biosynthetic protein FliO [Dehalococcoidia bacterium]
MNDPKTRKKLLWAAALGGAMLCSLVFISTLAPQADPVTNSPVIRTNDAGQFLLTDAPAAETQPEAGGSSGFSLGGGELVSLAWRLALVIVIIAVSIAALRWWGKKTAGPKSATGFLRVIDTLAISNGRTIHLVALGDRVIAIGATAQQLTLLNELSEDEASRVFADAARPDEVPLGQFAAQLFDQMKRTAHRQERRDSEAVTARDRA